MVDENKECAKYITKLKEELKSSNEKSSNYIKDKEQILNQTRYLSEQNQKLHLNNSNLEKMIKVYESNHIIHGHQLCPVHDHVCFNNSNMSFNTEELNNQIYQLESQITYLENKVRELNIQNNEKTKNYI